MTTIRTSKGFEGPRPASLSHSPVVRYRRIKMHPLTPPPPMVLLPLLLLLLHCLLLVLGRGGVEGEDVVEVVMALQVGSAVEFASWGVERQGQGSEQRASGASRVRFRVQASEPSLSEPGSSSRNHQSHRSSLITSLTLIPTHEQSVRRTA